MLPSCTQVFSRDILEELRLVVTVIMTSSLAGIAVDDHVVRRSEVVSVVLTAISFAIGALIVVQASLNINLGDTLGQPIRASCVSFWVGTVVLVVVVLRKHTGKKDWWRISDNEEVFTLNLL